MVLSDLLHTESCLVIPATKQENTSTRLVVIIMADFRLK